MAQRIRLVWQIEADELWLYLERPDGRRDAFSSSLERLRDLELLDLEIDAEADIEPVVGSYRQFLRGFQHARFAYENAEARIREILAKPIHVELSATEDTGSTARSNLILARPWELLLDIARSGQLAERLRRITITRTLGRSDPLEPRKISDSLRVLLLQGAGGAQPLDFAREATAILDAHAALGPEIRRWVAKPAIRPARLERLVDDLIEVDPQLLWFSGHGWTDGDDFKLCFAGGAEGQSVSVQAIAEAVSEAHERTSQRPLFAALWACESGRGRLVGPPSLSAREAGFPVAVRAFTEAGVEAVIGVQTRIWDGSARILAEALFRALAEGQGPAPALAAAREALYRCPTADEAGSPAEWVSPVLWTGGAFIPHLDWKRDVGESESLFLHKAAHVSLQLGSIGGNDVLTERPEEPSAAAWHWIDGAPCWVTSPDLPDEEACLSVIRAFWTLSLSANPSRRGERGETHRPVLLIRYDLRRDADLLAAVARAMKDIKDRILPGALPGSAEWLVAFLDAFERRERRRDAWARLLDRDDLVVAILAPAGLPDHGVYETLDRATDAAAKLIVVSDEGPEQGAPEGFWNGWTVDEFGSEPAPPPPSDEATRAFAESLACLSLPLSARDLDRLGRDFGLHAGFERLRDQLSEVGHHRYMLKGSVASAALAGIPADRRRAAHRACLGFLERAEPRDLRAREDERLRSLYQHATAAGEEVTAVRTANRLVRELAERGRHADTVHFLDRMGEQRNQLEPAATADAAKALIEMGQPARAHDRLRRLRRLPESELPHLLRLRIAVLEADALRNTKRKANQEKAIALLEQVTAEPATSNPEIERWRLIARHDHARNLHYFRHDTEAAIAIFEEVVAACGEQPDRMYLKAAALRNLSDALDRYTFGRREPDPAAAEARLREACEVAEWYAGARPLLAEMQYQLAKMVQAAGKPDRAIRQLDACLATAREDGVGFVLGLARNKVFWWRLGTIDPDAARAFSPPDWDRLEDLLELASGHAWVQRALIGARIRAARCFHLRDDRGRAQALLERSLNVLRSEALALGSPGDLERCWAPVYAGLLVLSAEADIETTAEGRRAAAPDWNQLVERAKTKTREERQDERAAWTAKDPAAIWKGVR